MKIYLTDQKMRLGLHLEKLKEYAIQRYDKNMLRENLTSINLSGRLSELNLQLLFDYKIFPNHIMSCLGQWEMEKRHMQVGDTIVQQVYLPPIKFFSQKIIFGVRINAIIDQPKLKGFSYETLEGHVEKGISTFTIEETAAGVIFTIHTFSSPGNFLAKLLGPVFSLPYQRFCTRKALQNVKQQFDYQAEPT